MVVTLGPGKFYGSSLPRPRFYTDVKFSDARVDPPVSVMDPLLSWAHEAHWSMGGLSLNRVRLQGKIEGNVEKLRKEQEKKEMISTPVLKSKGKRSRKILDSSDSSDSDSDADSAPAAPMTRKLRSRVVGGEDEEEVGKGGVAAGKRRRLVRKLGDDFEMVADKNEKSNKSPNVLKKVVSRNRVRRNMVLMEDEEEGNSDTEITVKILKDKKVEKTPVTPNEKRSSPRLKQRLN